MATIFLRVAKVQEVWGKSTLKTQGEIAKDFSLSQKTVSDINLGEIWYDDNEKYPLRDKNSFRKERAIYKRQEKEKLENKIP